LRWLILLVVALGVAQYGGFRWWRAAEARRNFPRDERPVHEVTISTPFYLGRFEVTQEQYQQVLGTAPACFIGQNLPVENVSWDDAQEFCKKASERTNLMVRLPTEAEWEYACRAGTTTRFCSGDADADLESVAWYGANSGGTTHAVGQKKPNAWGLYDMHGNVFEWCADSYANYSAESVTDPQGPTQGECRVLRGGSWFFNPRLCRSTSRDVLNPVFRGRNIGFRVAMSLPTREGR
jgi:formylglycine-generating enzyme required for sulfatase activity